MINHKFPCISVNFVIFVMVKSIPFDKIFENSPGAGLLLAKQSIAVLINRTCHLMIFGDFVN